MTEIGRKKALLEIQNLENNNKTLVQNNKEMEEELKELENIHDKDEETINKIKSLQEKIEANNATINSQNVAIEKLKSLLEEEIKKEIEKFNITSVRIESHLQMVKTTLMLENNIEETNVRTILTGLTEEIKIFESKSVAIINEINEFRELTQRDDFNMTAKEIKAKVKGFKTKLKELKIEQVTKYNLRVEYVNSIIKEYKSTVKEDSELYSLVCQLEEVSLCTATVTEWRHTSYLTQIDYKKIVEVTKIIKLIEEKRETRTSLDGFRGRFENVRNHLNDLDVQINEDMHYATIIYANGMLDRMANILLSIGQDLESEKNELSDEEYREYTETYRELMQTYFALRKRLTDVEKNVNKEEVMDYNNLSNKLNVIETEVNDFEFTVSSLFGNVLSSSYEVLMNKYSLLEEKIASFKKLLDKEMNASLEERLLDVNQFENLEKRLNVVKNTLSNTGNKLKDPKMFNIEKANDVYDFLNGSIEGVEKTLEGLEITLGHLDKPIKDRETRKNLDMIFKELEAEIKRLEKQLEIYKDKDEEESEDKYKATKERLNNAKKRMNALGKQYRRKCPLLVRAVKSAKHFFKKYKKVLLIIAGLVAFAMVAHSVIIPAIMHGNIMTAYFSPVLRGPIKTINNLLGGLIGATKSPFGVWTLANGAVLNPATATASLLKGLAISGIGSAALVAPLIVAIKKLIEKINMAELKQKLMEGKDNVVNGAKNVGTKIKDGTHKVVNGVKTGVTAVKTKTTEFIEETKVKNAKTKAKKDVMKDVKALIIDYTKSGLTVDEYCELHQITDYRVDVLRKFEISTSEKKENTGRRKAGK